MTQRSTTADDIRKLYFIEKWHTLRGIMLTRDQYHWQQCRVILTGGRYYPRSAIVHQKQTHKGAMTLFYETDNLESVFWSCHSGAIQSAFVCMKIFDETRP